MVTWARGLTLHALSQGVIAHSEQAAFRSLQGFDPWLKNMARRRIRASLAAASRLTTSNQPEHVLRVAFFEASKQIPEASYDDVAALAAEYRTLASETKSIARGPWLSGLTLLFIAMLAVAVVAASHYLRPFDPRESPAGHLLSETVPNFVVALNRTDQKGLAVARQAATGASAQAALGKASSQQLGALLDRLNELKGASEADREGSQATVASAAAAFNRTLHEQALPFFVDATALRIDRETTPLLLSFYVEQDARVRAGSHSVRVVRLRRLDGLNLRQGYLGYTRPDTPAALVLLDQIESDLVRYVLPALPKFEIMRLVDDKTRERAEPWVSELEEKSSDLLREHYRLSPGQLDDHVYELGRLLARRRALIEGWHKTLEGQGRRLRTPRRLIPEAKYSEELAIMVPRAELREWDSLHEALLDQQSLKAFSNLRDRYANSVERHEVQHRLDYERVAAADNDGGGRIHGIPPLLAQRLGMHPDDDKPPSRLALRARDELSAYLASIVHSHDSPILDLLLLSRFLFNRSGSGAAYRYAALAVFEGLGQTLNIGAQVGVGRRQRAQVAELLYAICRHPPVEIRAAAATLYKRMFGLATPAVESVSLTRNRAWHH